MADVKWIKMKVGMFDGMSFKKIKKAKIGGESFRDKLTAIWFELMDFAGRCNQDGAFISPREIPFTDLSDIATMIDREEEELQLCMGFYVKEGMVTITDDIYSIANWSEYQNTEGLEKIREQNRIRKQKQRDKERFLIECDNLDDMSRDMSRDVTQQNKNKEEDKDKDKELYISIVEYLNQKAGTNYKPSSKATQTKIHARLKEGYTLDDFKLVIDKKCDEWKGTQMEQYLRPETLFGTKFESYLNAKIVKEDKKPKNGFNNFEGRQYSSDQMRSMEKLLLQRSMKS